MRRTGRATLAFVLTTFAFLPHGAAIARPYRIGDMLRLQTYGAVQQAPSGDFALVERSKPYDEAGAYDYGAFSARLLSTIEIVDLRRPTAPTPLFQQSRDAGYWIGSISPDSRHVSVFRLQHHRLTLGVVDIAHRQARWWRIYPDLPVFQPKPMWADDKSLVVVDFVDPQLPWELAFGHLRQSGLTRFWRVQRDGRTPSVTAVSDFEPDALPRPPVNRVNRIDLVTGKVTALFGDHAIRNIAVSPDGRHVAAIVAGEPAPPPLDTIVDVGTPDRRYTLVIGTLDRPRSPWRAVAGDAVPALLSWSADSGTVLAALIRPSGPSAAVDLVRVPVSTLKPSPVVTRGFTATAATNPDGIAAVQAGWIGHSVLAHGRSADGQEGWWIFPSSSPARALPGLPATARIVRFDDDGAFALMSGTLWSIDAEGTQKVVRADVARLVDTQDRRSGRRPDILPSAPTTIPATVSETKDRAVLRPGGDDRPAILLPKGQTTVVEAISVAAGTALLRTTSPAGVSDLSLVSSRGASSRLDRINRHLADVDTPVIVKLMAELSDGRRHPAWLYLPRPSAGDARFPLVVVPYAGEVFDTAPLPVSAPDRLAPTLSIPLMVGHGYAVLVPSIPFDGAKADDYRSIVEDTLRQTEAALATGRVDAHRIALYGHSYGGYSALAAAVHTDRFCAIIASNGPSDFLAQWGEPTPADEVALDRVSPYAGNVGITEGGQVGLGAPPWVATARYLSRSPFYAVDRIRTPLMLVSGDLDYVSIAQSERLYAALARLGRPVTLLRYWGEGHLLVSPANIADQYRRIFAWLDARFGESRCRQGSGPLPETGPAREVRVEAERPIVPAHGEAF